jgi:hypothetical protein
LGYWHARSALNSATHRRQSAFKGQAVLSPLYPFSCYGRRWADGFNFFNGGGQITLIELDLSA